MEKRLKHTKKRLMKALSCSRVINYWKLFIISEGVVKNYEDFIYRENMNEDNVCYFSALFLKPGVYVGEMKYAVRLRDAFGGEVVQTEYRHIAEWKWISPKGELSEEEAIKAIFCMV